jgi:hypothetical protein
MQMHLCNTRRLDSEDREVTIVASVTMTHAEHVRLYAKPAGLPDFVVFLTENAGRPRSDWFIVYGPHERAMDIQFVRENDALMFLLRFSA